MALKQFKDKEEYLLGFKTVKRWLSGIANSRTRTQYIWRLYRYCFETGLTPNQIIEEKAKAMQNPHLAGLAEDRLKSWYRKTSQKTPADSICVFKVVRSFCKANYVPLSAKIPTYVEQREETYIPTKPEVRAMCELAPRLEVKTLFLLLSESGRRIGTLSDLRYKNVKEGLESWKPNEPFCFSIPQKRQRCGLTN